MQEFAEAFSPTHLLGQLEIEQVHIAAAGPSQDRDEGAGVQGSGTFMGGQVTVSLSLALECRSTKMSSACTGGNLPKREDDDRGGNYLS